MYKLYSIAKLHVVFVQALQEQIIKNLMTCDKKGCPHFRPTAQLNENIYAVCALYISRDFQVTYLLYLYIHSIINTNSKAAETFNYVFKDICCMWCNCKFIASQGYGMSKLGLRLSALQEQVHKHICHIPTRDQSTILYFNKLLKPPHIRATSS